MLLNIKIMIFAILTPIIAIGYIYAIVFTEGQFQLGVCLGVILHYLISKLEYFGKKLAAETKDSLSVY